ncbi:MAG: septal ring lytic transglycosylase RlpA family protein [Chloroflexota bacterium]
MIEPDLRSEPATAPVRGAQPVARAGSVALSRPRSTGGAGVAGGTGVAGGWHHDNDISWFGPGLYGNGTACGKTLTKTLVGVAHRTLPCGTRVTFRYKGVTLTVPVVDRGPFVAGRTWDLTHGACAKLNHCFTGSIDWKLGGG